MVKFALPDADFEKMQPGTFIKTDVLLKGCNIKEACIHTRALPIPGVPMAFDREDSTVAHNCIIYPVYQGQVFFIGHLIRLCEQDEPLQVQFGYKTMIVKSREPNKLKLKPVVEDCNVMVFEDKRQRFTLITSPTAVNKADWT